MDASFKLSRFPATSPASAAHIRGGVSRRVGGLRSAILSGENINTDQMSGMAKAIQESIEETFGKLSLDEQLEADRSAYEMKTIF